MQKTGDQFVFFQSNKTVCVYVCLYVSHVWVCKRARGWGLYVCSGVGVVCMLGVGVVSVLGGRGCMCARGWGL